MGRNDAQEAVLEVLALGETCGLVGGQRGVGGVEAEDVDEEVEGGLGDVHVLVVGGGKGAWWVPPHWGDEIGVTYQARLVIASTKLLSDVAQSSATFCRLYQRCAIRFTFEHPEFQKVDPDMVFDMGTSTCSETNSERLTTGEVESRVCAMSEVVPEVEPIRHGVGHLFALGHVASLEEHAILNSELGFSLGKAALYREEQVVHSKDAGSHRRSGGAVERGQDSPRSGQGPLSTRL
ncbi:hypothetical protein HDU93_008616, partial [Gonapodya sp. JEL0774]